MATSFFRWMTSLPRDVMSVGRHIDFVLIFVCLFTAAIIQKPLAVSANPLSIALNYQIVEELPVGTEIGRGLIVDGQLSAIYTSQQLSDLRFSLVQDPSSDVANRHFNVQSQSAILEIKSVIDRDQLCPRLEACSIKFDVVVVCSTGCFHVISIQVDILDINDNSPSFSPPGPVTITIPESASPGSQFPIPVALDADSPTLAIQRYELYPVGSRSTFSLRWKPLTQPPQLVLSSHLDRESVSEYQLVVVTVDGGQPALSASCTVRIDVGDVNDNDPIFEREIYTVSVSENATRGTLLTTVRASDADIGENGHVTYHLLPVDGVADATELFVLNEETGQLVLGQGAAMLDRESREAYRLTVEARDGGLPVRSAGTTVVINLIDVNDNVPQVAVSTVGNDGRGHVTENSPVGTFAGLVMASDPDAGDNGVTWCQLEPGPRLPLFRLEQLSAGGSAARYKLVTDSVLDREAVAEHRLVIVCTDRGIPTALSTKREVIVAVDDVNDNAPIFQLRDYQFSVAENENVGHVIGRVNASDADIGSNSHITYRKLSADRDPTDALFHVEPETGIIRVAEQLDYELGRHFRFQIEASDAGQPSFSATVDVDVEIEDVNDISPTFVSRKYVFKVAENQPSGTVVGRVVAVDSEAGANGDIRYTIVAPMVENSDVTIHGEFVIDPITGVITTTQALDREARNSFSFSIAANDSGFPVLSGVCDVTVDVGDLNDNAPVFDFPSSVAVASTDDDEVSVRLSSYAKRNRRVTRIIAHDDDAGDNAAISYFIDSGGELFKIDRMTGVIYVSVDDLMSRDGETLTIALLAVDGGSPPRTSSANLTIAINASFELLTGGAYYLDIDSNDVVDNISGLLVGSQRRSPVSLLENPNFMIVVGVAAATVIVAVALVVAIICVAVRSRRNHTVNDTSGHGVIYRQNGHKNTPPPPRRTGSRLIYETREEDDRLSVLESLTGNGNTKLPPGPDGDRMSEGLLSTGRNGGRCCNDFESFGKLENANLATERGAVPAQKSSHPIVSIDLTSAAGALVPAAVGREGDRDSASSDSGHGHSEDDYNPAANHTTCLDNSSDNSYKTMPVKYRTSGTAQPQTGPAQANRNSGGAFPMEYNIPPTSALVRASALPRCTSHELALSVNNQHPYYPYSPNQPASNFLSSVSTLPSSTAPHTRQQYPSHSSLRRPESATGSNTSQSEGVATLSRGQRRVTFSNSSPASRYPRPPSVCVLPPDVGVSLSPPPSLQAGYGTASSSGGEMSDGASMTSQTSGSYVVNDKPTDAGGAARPAQTVSYIFV